MSQSMLPADRNSNETEAVVAPGQRQPYSTLAITGFVLSLVGCLGFTAVLGLIFGIAGIMKTKGGQKRGFGLAVAAIPISVVTGLLGLGGLYAWTLFQVMDQRVQLVATCLRATSGETASGLEALRAGCTQDFNESVPAETLNRWLQTVSAKHGTLVSEVLRPKPVNEHDQTLSVLFNAKFVNGPTPIVIRFMREGLTDLRVNDIEVDGLSPRRKP